MKRLAKFLFTIIVGLLLVWVKVRMGLHDHFFAGLIVMGVIALCMKFFDIGEQKNG
jgi:small basic protein